MRQSCPYLRLGVLSTCDCSSSQSWLDLHVYAFVPRSAETVAARNNCTLLEVGVMWHCWVLTVIAYVQERSSKGERGSAVGASVLVCFR